LSYLKTVLSNRPSFGNLKVDLLSEEIKMRWSPQAYADIRFYLNS
jgi:hypothetical protein